ncbi:MAG: hypothetical protein E6J54_30645 [Deltaproteobacteria bacterium]|nr:MAG: hypothetical protein E6J54_30645 [Deltaproteobacteria bacterium]
MSRLLSRSHFRHTPLDTCHFVGIDEKGKEFVMPKYDIYVSCPECHGEHPMGIGIHLDDGPDEKRSIGDSYQGKSLPPQVSAIQGHKCLCLKTGKEFRQEDNEQVFLVPTWALPRRPMPPV